MWTVRLLLSITGDDAPAAKAMVVPRKPRCENARVQPVEAAPSGATPGARALRDEPLANAYRPVVRHAHCDVPVVVATRIGNAQR